MLFVRHIFELLLYAVELHRDILNGYAHYGGNLLVAHILEPQHNNRTIKGLQTVYALVITRHLAKTNFLLQSMVV